ncbi:MAG TPA: hypothetical protein VK101_02010, partial [Limnochordia bacterium]|nr:hypothetical protein [Limnochordia bacterium]
MKWIKALRQNLGRWAVDTFRKTGVRQWGLAALVFVALAGILLANAVTERVDLKVGQISPKDIQAPQRVINRYQTDRLRAAEADRAVTQAVQDPANYIIDQTAAVEAREQIA